MYQNVLQFRSVTYSFSYHQRNTKHAHFRRLFEAFWRNFIGITWNLQPFRPGIALEINFSLSACIITSLDTLNCYTLDYILDQIIRNDEACNEGILSKVSYYLSFGEEKKMKKILNVTGMMQYVQHNIRVKHLWIFIWRKEKKRRKKNCPHYVKETKTSRVNCRVVGARLIQFHYSFGLQRKIPLFVGRKNIPTVFYNSHQNMRIMDGVWQCSSEIATCIFSRVSFPIQRIWGRNRNS